MYRCKAFAIFTLFYIVQIDDVKISKQIIPGYKILKAYGYYVNGAYPVLE